MAVANPFSITYGAREIGGSSNSYQLHDPYVISKSFETLQLTCNVVVVGSSYSDLKTKSKDLEDDFRKRDQDLTINLSGSTWVYTFGTSIFNTKASISKSGDPETDQGFSRAYTIVVEGELPADDAGTGLQDIEWNVDHEAGRQRIVTCRGIYTATDLAMATDNYQDVAGADAEASTFLGALSGGKTYELVDESYQADRTDAKCTFHRQYVELLFNQTSGSLDSTNIKDHRVAFTDLSQHPGDSKENIYRMRRVKGSYDCAIDIEQTTNLQSVFESEVKDHLVDTFVASFSPTVYAIEDASISYDETTKRMSIAFQFLYQKNGGEDIVELSQEIAYREGRVVDYTPIHNGGELSAVADPGWMVLERIASRTVTVVGEEKPRRRLGTPDPVGLAGEIDGLEAPPTVQKEGWNLIQNTSQARKVYIGDPDFGRQIAHTILTEMVVERFNEKAPIRGATSWPKS